MAEPVDVAKTADGAVVLAQVRWGYRAEINLCYLVLDDAAVEVLRANPPQTGPMWSGDEVDDAAAQRCSRHHGFGAEPVDVAKTADGAVVLAQVRWGYRADINLCYLVLNDMALEALRAAAQPRTAAQRCSRHHGFGAEPVDVAKTADGAVVLAQVRWGYRAEINLCYLVLDDAAVEVLRANPPQTAFMWSGDEVNDAAAQRCSRHHGFGAEPVDVAKTADGAVVLAQVRWGYRADINLCYLVLNDMALEALRMPQRPPRFMILRENYGCGMRVDATIACWGDNRAGQASAPQGRFSRLYSGGDSSAEPGYWCGLRADRAAVCWGDNRAGRASPPEGQFSQLYLRDSFACGLRTNGAISCWGDNRGEAWQPAQGQFTHVSIADSRGCGLRTDQSVACWGDIASPPEGQFSQLYLRDSFACGLRTDQAVACWGDIASPPEGQFSQLYLRDSFACGLRTDQTVVCWGDNSLGQTDAPAGRFNSVILADDYGCGLRIDRVVLCWGDNSHGQTNVFRNQQFIRIFLKDDFVCGLRVAGIIACWGDIASTPGGFFTRMYLADDYGCGLRRSQSIACWGQVTASPPGQFTRIYLDPWEEKYRCGLRTDQTIACWGDNTHGQTNTPNGQFTDLFLTAKYGCGLRTDQTIACWGDNTHGQTNTPTGQFV
ncbi:hypothetical protein [Candidatus Poriferisocius sp.]|uniref:hypothetical protein n=1 Tax=Candidatus Poriferisocius sp. TaxID=3101276 RepID=UPI003B01EA01